MAPPAVSIIGMTWEFHEHIFIEHNNTYRVRLNYDVKVCERQLYVASALLTLLGVAFFTTPWNLIFEIWVLRLVNFVFELIAN